MQMDRPYIGFKQILTADRYAARKRSAKMSGASWKDSPVVMWVPFGIFLLALFLMGCEIKVLPPVHGPRVLVHPGYPAPPAIVLGARPKLVFVADFGLYVAAELDADLYFYKGVWLYYHNDSWYKSGGYEGPWLPVKRNHLPPGLAQAPPRQIKKMARSMKPMKPGRGRGR